MTSGGGGGVPLRKGYAGEVFRSSRAAIRMSLIRRGGPEQMLTIHKQEHAPGRRGFREQCDKYTAVEKRGGPTGGRALVRYDRTYPRRENLENLGIFNKYVSFNGTIMYSRERERLK